LGSGLGSTRTKRPVGEALSPMRTPELRVRALTGVPWGSGLTGRRWRQGEPPDEEEDPPVSMRLGIQKLPRRREKDGGAGYSRRGVLPPSIYSRTASNVRPGTPHH